MYRQYHTDKLFILENEDIIYKKILKIVGRERAKEKKFEKKIGLAATCKKNCRARPGVQISKFSLASPRILKILTSTGSSTGGAFCDEWGR